MPVEAQARPGVELEPIPVHAQSVVNVSASHYETCLVEQDLHAEVGRRVQ